MKHVALIAALMVGLMGMPVAFAEQVQGGDILGISSEPIKSVSVSADTASAGSFQAGSLILGLQVYANDAGDGCGLYDTATLTGASLSALIDEVYEATDEETSGKLWPRPYKLVTDLTVATSGVCTIYYQ